MPGINDPRDIDNRALFHPPLQYPAYNPFRNEHRDQLETALNPQVMPNTQTIEEMLGEWRRPGPVSPQWGPLGPTDVPQIDLMKQWSKFRHEDKDLENQRYYEDSLRLKETAATRAMQKRLQKYPTGTKRDY